MASIEEQIKSLLEKSKEYDVALENADPAIITCREIPTSELSHDALCGIYDYQYPKNVDWLNKHRPEWMKEHHPNEF